MQAIRRRKRERNEMGERDQERPEDLRTKGYSYARLGKALLGTRVIGEYGVILVESVYKQNMKNGR